MLRFWRVGGGAGDGGCAFRVPCARACSILGPSCVGRTLVFQQDIYTHILRPLARVTVEHHTRARAAAAVAAASEPSTAAAAGGSGPVRVGGASGDGGSAGEPVKAEGGGGDSCGDAAIASVSAGFPATDAVASRALVVFFTVVVEYLRSLHQHMLPVEPVIHALVVEVALICSAHTQLQQFLQYQVPNDSVALALRVMQLVRPRARATAAPSRDARPRTCDRRRRRRRTCSRLQLTS